MNWQSSVQVFIDPLIKENNKYLIQMVENLSTQSGFQIVTDFNMLKHLPTPKIVIFEELGQNITELLKNNLNYFIQIDQPNLDLFSLQINLENSFIIKDENELQNVFGLINIVLENVILKVRIEFILLGKSHLESLSSKVHKVKYEAPRDETLFHKIEKDIFEIYDLDEIIIYINELNKEFITRNIEIKKFGEILSEKREGDFIPLGLDSENPLFLCWNNKGLVANEVLELFEILESCLKNHSVLFDSNSLRVKWERRLSNFDLPIVILDDLGEILIHNRHFIDLNISTKDCLSFEHNEQITNQKNIYRVIRGQKKSGFSEFIFVPVNEFLVQSDKPSFEELGIISSSVAHELNNPLAGISAALDVLMLDDFPEDTMSELIEMKKGVHRCRNLVEIFLGFSKVKTDLELGVENGHSIEQALEQAHELIRFRLIENNVVLKIDYKLRQGTQVSFDESVLTMIFYLLLGELLTSFSHHNLVVRGGSKQLNLKIEEDGHLLTIHLTEELTLSRGFFDSKLLLHLFDLLKMKINLSNNYLKISL